MCKAHHRKILIRRLFQVSQGSLHPTLTSLSSGPVAPATNEHSLCNRVTKGLDQYLQDAEQLHASEDNYFDGIIRSTNTILEVEEQVDQTSQNNVVPAKQQFIDEKESAINIPKSQQIDTSYSSQWQQYQIAYHIKTLI